MHKRFVENVEKLFKYVVTKREAVCHNAEELRDILMKRVTSPIKAEWKEDCLRLVYYNVTIEVKRDLSEMVLSYNSEFTMGLQHLENCDMLQLADFVVALEKDIPRWKHIWMTDKLVRKERTKMDERRKNVMRSIKNSWIASIGDSIKQMERTYRIQFYNVKAMELMLDNDNPYWEKKKTEEEIVKECMKYHISTPMEQWFEEWTAFIEECQKEKDERVRRQDEYRNMLLKKHHIIQIRLLKMNSFINTIEFHEGISVQVLQPLDMIRHYSKEHEKYNINLNIEGEVVRIRLKYSLVDACLEKIMESLKRINDMMPELKQCLEKDKKEKGANLLTLNHNLRDAISERLYITKCGYVLYEDDICHDLPSCKVVESINNVLNDLNGYIEKAMETKSRA